MYYIYRITNLVNGKTYIGKHKYKKLDEYYMGSGVHLKRAQKKYGIENFEKKILVFNISKLEHINLLEKTFIAAEREKVGRENCYNKSDGGDGGALNKGRKLSEEWKKHISEGGKGKRRSEETKKKLSEAGKKRCHSEETKRKIAEAARNMTEEHKRKIAEAAKGRPSPMKGKHHTEETKKKLSDLNKGKRHSEESYKRAAEKLKGRPAWNKGKHHTEEAKRKISEAGKGRHFSEDHKRKIGESNRGKLKGKHYYNNGEISVLADVCPEGFIKGRLTRH